MKPLFLAILLGGAMASAANAFTVNVDLVPLTEVFDGFNDGIDTTGAFNNASSAGEAGGVSSVTIPASASDPQFQYLTPTAISPFRVDDHPFVRVQSRGSVGGAAQLFPLPAAGGTVVDFNNTANNFGEARLTFVTPGPNGTGLRFDPLSNGATAAATFDYDYIHLDQYPTISIGEFDRDSGRDGWNPNPGFPSPVVTAATSAVTATTANNDPNITKSGFAINTSVYEVIEFRIAVDEDSTSRFEFFWGTSTFPGPAGGQSIAITSEIIRDGEFHTYRYDMSDEPRWDGTLNLIRIDPLADADAAAGRTFSIDYVRLISGAGVLDTDGDGLPDNVETDTFVFNGLRDTGCDLNNPDSDNDTFSDGDEIRLGTNPVDDQSFPTGVIDGYDLSPAIYAIDIPISSNFPFISNGTLSSASITPALPAGLNFATDTGEISGTPTALSAPAIYTVTAVFQSGATGTFDLTLEVANPRITSYTANPATYTRNTMITPNTPALLGGAPVSYAVSPDLPEGLSLNSITGEITGTPAGFGGPENYTVNAFYNSYPDSTIVLTIGVLSAPIIVTDPVDLITDFSPIGEWETDGDSDSWIPGGNPAASLSIAGGLATISVPTAPSDPQFTRNGLAANTENGANAILEIRMRQNQSPPLPVEIFWADAGGGFAAARRTQISPSDVPDDNDFHVYHILLHGVFDGNVTALRIDPGNDANTSFDFDYVRLGNFELPEPLKITDIRFNFLDEAEITWTSQEGKTYTIESSTDLSIWSPLNSTPVNGSPGQETTTFPDTTSPGMPERYYRVFENAP